MMRRRLETGFSPFEEKQIYPVQETDSPKAVRGTQSYSLYRAMHKGGVVELSSGKTKEQVIKQVIQKTAPKIGFDPEVVTELLLDREELMTTAVNQGIAIPHPRDSILETPGSDLIITAFLNSPIDYGALDGKPVHTLFFLFSSTDKTHLHLLSKLAHFSSQENVLSYLTQRPKFEDYLSFVKEWESSLLTTTRGT